MISPDEITLASPVMNVTDAINAVQKELARIRSGAVQKRAVVSSLLSDIHSQLTYATKLVKSNVYRSYEDVITFRDSVKASSLSCQSLGKLVKEKKIRPKELASRLVEVSQKLEADLALGQSIVSYMVESTSLSDPDADVDSRAASRDRRENAAAVRSGRILKQLKDAHEHKVPKTFGDSLRFIQLPVMANFGSMSMNVKTLSAMGFPVVAAGLHSTPSSDLGIVFEDQMLMLFRLSHAQDAANDIIEAHRDIDQVRIRRKALQRKRQQANRELKELNALLETARKTSRPVLKRQIEEVQATVNSLGGELDALDQDFKVSKSRERIVANTVKSDDHVIINYVTPILDAVNEKKGTNYTMLTARPLKGIMRDADVAAVWLMDRNAVNLLLTHTNTDLRLSDWYLPWAKGE